MKKLVARIFVFALLIVEILGNGSTVVSGKSLLTLTSREKAIGKAYIKSCETRNPKYLNKYRLKNLDKYTMEEFYTKFKYLKVNYSKKYDKNEKLNYIKMDGLVLCYCDDNAVVCNFTTGIYIIEYKSKVYSYTENSNVENFTPILPETLSMKYYNKVINYLTKSKGYTENEVYKMLDNGRNLSYSDGDDSSEYENRSNGDIDNKFLLSVNDSYTWKATKDCYQNDLKGTYKFTVNESYMIWEEQAKKMLSFSYVEGYDYYIANVTFQANVKNTGDRVYITQSFIPQFCNIYFVNADPFRDYQNVTSAGFENSLMDNFIVNSEYNDSIKLGDTLKIETSGDLLIGVPKDVSSYLSIQMGNTGNELYYRLTLK